MRTPTTKGEKVIDETVEGIYIILSQEPLAEDDYESYEYRIAKITLKSSPQPDFQTFIYGDRFAKFVNSIEEEYGILDSEGHNSYYGFSSYEIELKDLETVVQRFLDFLGNHGYDCVSEMTEVIEDYDLDELL